VQARDNELRRLEAIVAELQTQLNDEQEAYHLFHERLRLAEEKLRSTESAKLQREEFWKVAQRISCVRQMYMMVFRIQDTLRKLREEMESIRWGHEEELRIRNQQIEVLGFHKGIGLILNGIWVVVGVTERSLSISA
jgi:hypothetical protein